jgi:hypothetical protein
MLLIALAVEHGPTKGAELRAREIAAPPRPLHSHNSRLEGPTVVQRHCLMGQM